MRKDRREKKCFTCKKPCYGYQCRVCHTSHKHGKVAKWKRFKGVTV